MADLTNMLRAALHGDKAAEADFFDKIYEELKRLASARLVHEPANLTLDATSLVNEVYLRLFQGGRPDFQNRAHFFAAAGEAMRRILVEHARRRNELKHGGRCPNVALPGDVADPHRPPQPLDVLAVEDALIKLNEFDPRLCEIVKLRCFVGMSIPGIADALGLSTRTVNREWRVAKAWLRSELGDTCQ